MCYRELSSGSVLLYIHRDHKDYYGRGVQNGHFDFFAQFLTSEATGSVQYCFTSTETIKTIMDGEPRTAATSTFTQLLSSDATAERELTVLRSGACAGSPSGKGKCGQLRPPEWTACLTYADVVRTATPRMYNK